MVLRPRAFKEFWAGVLYVGLSMAFLLLGQNYRFGTAAEMGPGYFPLVLASVLGILGLTQIVKSFLVDGEGISPVHWRPLALVSLACVGFGLLVMTAGLVLALGFAVIVSAAASRETTYDLRSLAVLVVLIVFCILVFIKGLGVPMPIFGSLFDGIVPASWQH